MEILIWTLYFVTPKYSDFTQCYMMLVKQFDLIVAKDQATATWLDEDQIPKFLLAWSRDWTTLLPLRKTLSTLHFQLGRLLKQYVSDCARYSAEKNIIKELRLFIDGSLQGFSFCPPKTFTLNKQTSRNTKHLHGIAWSSGNVDYDKLFAVFYDIKVMNAEVFAKGLEKCTLLTSLLGQNVENLDN